MPGGAGGRGRFITLEGGEGAGKSTQARRLADALTARGIDCVLTREPGGSTGAEEIRALLVNGAPGRWSATTEALLLTAARRDHLERTVLPALAAGRWVVCDRFADSTLAYQGYGAGLPLEDLRALFRLALGGATPDLTLVFDLPVEVGLARAAARAAGASAGIEDRFERMDVAFHQRLRAGFLAIAAAEPQRCAVVDASADMDCVTGDIMAIMRARLPESRL